jgi:hypothetical protein
VAVAMIIAAAVLGNVITTHSASAQAGAFSDKDLSRGFLRTVFGMENGSAHAWTVKKFTRPVRVEVVNLASKDRRKVIGGFVKSLPRLVPGLNIAMARKGAGNFTVYVVDRVHYVETARKHVFRDPYARVPGNCLVQVEIGADGIRRSSAVIVSDESESRFQRCMVEEILQGLGPMNDDGSLAESVFNDQSGHDRFTSFDRAILSILYDARFSPGMSMGEAKRLLPAVISTVRKLPD